MWGVRISAVVLFLALLPFGGYPASLKVRGPFGGYLRKEVVSLREARFRKVVPQRYDFSCGAASLATIIKYYYGQEVSEREIVKEMLEIGDREKIRKKGFSLLDLKRYASSKGFVANGYRIKAKDLPKIKIPVIVLLNTRGYKHFVVLKGTDSNRVFLADPAVGNRSLRMEEFLKGWNGVIFVVYKKAPTTPLPLETRPKAPIMQAQWKGLMDWTGAWGSFRPPGEF